MQRFHPPFESPAIGTRVVNLDARALALIGLLLFLVVTSGVAAVELSPVVFRWLVYATVAGYYLAFTGMGLAAVEAYR